MSRDAGIILGILVLAILVGGILYMGSTPPVPAGREVSFSVLSAGAAAANMTEQKNFRATDAAQLAEVWALAHGEGAKPPAVNFEKEEVLAVFDGERPSGGYGVSVERVVDNGSVREVSILHAAPGPSCATSEAVTSPFQIVRVKKSDNQIQRRDTGATVACE